MKKLIIILICCLAVTARAENIVSMSSASGHPQDEVTLNVSLANTDAAVAFQTEITLGSQLTYVAGSVTLNPSRITNHQVTAAVVNGTLKIYAYSLSLAPFVGNEGTLLSFTLRLKNEPSDYTLTLDNTKLSDASGTALPAAIQNGMVTILAPKLQINTPNINFGHVPIRSDYYQTSQVSNVGNEPLTITNITFNDAVFSCTSFTETTLQPGSNASFTFKFAPTLKGAVTATATIVSNSVSGNGTVNLTADPFAVNEIHVGNTMGYCDSLVELPISMNNMEGIIGFQIEFDLDAALEFVDFTLSDRKTNHVSTGVVVGNLLRLMAYSPTGAAFNGDDGVIGTVRFRLHGLYGYYYLNPSKAVLADANGEDVLSDKYQGYVNIRSPRISGNNSLSFGSTPVTETVTRDYVVYNNGNAPMRIDRIVFDQEGFSVAETFPLAVDEWGSEVLHVSYNREQKGDFNALMKIYSNDPQNGLKNVALSGNRYEPNSLELNADPFVLDEGDIAVSIELNNYSNVVAMQADFTYPYQDYSMASTDFQLTDRFANHLLFAFPTNDSTYRILVLSMQNATVDGHDGPALNVTLHPIGTPSEEDEYTVSLTNVVLSGVEGQNVFTGEDIVRSFALSATQTIPLIVGWNWFSTYIEKEDPIELLQTLETSLGANASQISSSEVYTEYDGGDWWGDLDNEGLTNEQMYMILVETPCTLQLRGKPANPANHAITIRPGWNWIGFPCDREMSLLEALGGYIAVEGDVLASSTDYSEFDGEEWFGDVDVLVPGHGYMYFSNSTKTMTLIIGGGK